MYATIEEIERANVASGLRWFEAGAKRFFGTRVLPTVYDGRYFITSERCTRLDIPRRYSVREAHKDGRISTVGQFHAYESRAEALRALQIHIRAHRYNPMFPEATRA